MKIIKYAQRLYECVKCGNRITTGTNHRGEIYPTCKGKCRQILNPHTAKEIVLPTQSAHKFIKDINN